MVNAVILTVNFITPNRAEKYPPDWGQIDSSRESVLYSDSLTESD